MTTSLSRCCAEDDFTAEDAERRRGVSEFLFHISANLRVLCSQFLPPSLTHGDHPIFWVLAEDQAAEANFLRDFVAVMLQPDGPFDASFRLGIFPIGHKLPIHAQPD